MKKSVPWIALVLFLAMTVLIHAEDTQTKYIDSNGLEKVSSLQKKPAGWKSAEIPKT
jgi:hypothetical protein